MAISFKGAHFPQEIILMGVRWYVAYPLSYRHDEGLLGASSEVSTLVQTLTRLDWKNEASVGESDPQRLNCSSAKTPESNKSVRSYPVSMPAARTGRASEYFLLAHSVTSREARHVRGRHSRSL